MFNTLWGFLSIAVICGVFTTWITANGGKPWKERVRKLQDTLDEVEDLQMELEKKLDQRDTKINDLEERIRVLERIVTDPRSRLDDEFQKLKTR